VPLFLFSSLFLPLTFTGRSAFRVFSAAFFCPRGSKSPPQIFLFWKTIQTSLLQPYFLAVVLSGMIPFFFFFLKVTESLSQLPSIRVSPLTPHPHSLTGLSQFWGSVPADPLLSGCKPFAFSFPLLPFPPLPHFVNDGVGFLGDTFWPRFGIDWNLTTFFPTKYFRTGFLFFLSDFLGLLDY